MSATPRPTGMPASAAPLPVAGRPTRRPRRDAVSNRARVLDAARARFAAQGVEAAHMTDIAADAGVGVGTLYRAFADKGALVAAVLDEQERAIQDAVLRGAPPLGPGAPASERLVAFLEVLVDFVDRNTEALLVVENGSVGARYRSGAYAGWRLHVSLLLAQARPDLDAVWHADALLAPLAADVFRHQRTALGLSLDRIRDGVRAAVAALVGAGPA